MSQLPKPLSAIFRRETYLGAGLAILIAAAWWPGTPIVTAMAVIMLGATEITLARFRGRAALLSIMILHGTIYASLYVVFVGATLHAAGVSSAAGVGGWTALDLAVSVIPLAFAMRRISCCLRQSISPQQ